MEDNRLQDLLAQWEGTYKKGLLSFWMLLLLSQRKAYPYEMSAAIAELSQHTVTAEDNSIYRALKRLAQSGIVDSEIRHSQNGPDRRYFYLTDLGWELLNRFITRNIQVFQHPQVADLIHQVTSSETNQEG